MNYRWESQCKIHGKEIGYAETPEKCEANAYAPGCEVDWWAMYPPEDEV